jgi:hypothetical protein
MLKRKKMLMKREAPVWVTLATEMKSAEFLLGDP